MNEKKKTLILLGVLAVLLVIIIMVVCASLIDSHKKIEEIKEVMNSKEPQIIYLSKPTCHYCNLIEPITSSLKEEFNLDYFNINTEELSNLELTKILKIIGVNLETFGTPYIAVVKDGKIIGEQIGYTDENVLFDLFRKHNLIKSNASLNMNYIDSIDELFNKENTNLVLIGKSGDTVSIEARLNLRKIASNHNFEINYFDTSKLEDETEYNELLDKLDVEKLPVLVIVENGNILQKTTEITNSSYTEFLKENNYIK